MKFNMKKNLCLLTATLLSVFGCTTSDDINSEIPVSSDDLIDQNVVYKSETVKVEVEDKKSAQKNEPVKPVEPATSDVKAKEEAPAEPVVADDKKVEEKVEEKVGENAEPSSEPVANADMAKVAEPEPMDVIVPPPATDDETIDFVETKYIEEEPTDAEFELAVLQAQQRRGIRPSSQRVEKKKVFVGEKKPAPEKVAKPFDKKLNVSELEPSRNIEFLSTVIYHSNTKADISSRDLTALKNVASFAKQKNAIIRVVGNASSRSRDMKEIQNKIANFDLSLLRAQRVRDALIKFGVPEDMVFISAVSDTEKVAEENMPINEAVNRRTEIYIKY